MVNLLLTACSNDAFTFIAMLRHRVFGIKAMKTPRFVVQVLVIFTNEHPTHFINMGMRVGGVRIGVGLGHGRILKNAKQERGKDGKG